MVKQIGSGLLVLSFSVLVSSFVADMSTRTKLHKIRVAWCVEVHSGELHGDYCVSPDNTAHPLPSYLE